MGKSKSKSKRRIKTANNKKFTSTLKRKDTESKIKTAKKRVRRGRSSTKKSTKSEKSEERTPSRSRSRTASAKNTKEKVAEILYLHLEKKKIKKVYNPGLLK